MGVLVRMAELTGKSKFLILLARRENIAMATEVDSVLPHVLSRALSLKLQLQRSFYCYFFVKNLKTQLDFQTPVEFVRLTAKVIFHDL